MKNRIAEASVRPDDVVAGNSYQMTVTVKLGEEGIPPGGRLMYDTPGYVGFSRPTLYFQEMEGFISFSCSDPEATYRTWLWNIEDRKKIETKEDYGGGSSVHATKAVRHVFIEFEKGVEPGATIEAKFGFACHGFGPGFKIGIVCPQPDFHAGIIVGYCGPGEERTSFEKYLRFRIRPAELARVIVLRKRRGEKVQVNVIPEDRFGNPADCPALEQIVETPVADRFQRNEHGVWRATVSPDAAADISAKNNLPLTNTAPVEVGRDGYTILFGDMHTHSSLSVDCKRRERMERTPRDLFRYARDKECLDFAAVTDHHQPWDTRPMHQLTGEEWQAVLDAVRTEAVAGEFVAFPGIEYRGRGGRGDTAIVFCGQVPYERMLGEELNPIDKFWDATEDLDYISIPHFHNPGGIPAGEWIYPDRGAQREPVLEVFSCHGRYDRHETYDRCPPVIKHHRPDRNAEFLLLKGYKYGIVCNSDGHKGHIGSNGLTAVLAKEVTAGAIFTALRARRCYGTTNARIRALLWANGLPMGTELGEVDEVRLEIDIVGTESLRAVDVIKDAEVLKRFRPGSHQLHEEVVDRPAPGKESFYYVRVIQEDQELAWTSPVWAAGGK